MRHQIPTIDEPVSETYLRTLDEIDRFAAKLDSRFNFPLTRLRFGWDPVIGLVPLAGDIFALALSIKVISTAQRLGASPHVLRKMMSNVCIDALAGLVPIFGTVFDVFFKANLQNVDLLMDEIRTQRSSTNYAQKF